MSREFMCIYTHRTLDIQVILGQLGSLTGIGQFHLEICSRCVLQPGMNTRPASWRMPNAKQMEKLARERAHAQPAAEPAFDVPQPAEWWDSVLSDPRAAGKPWIPIQQRRLSEIPRDLLRVECLRCFRAVEIKRLDAIRLYGPHAVYKDVGQRLLDDGCQHRTGRLEEDGCWPDWTQASGR